MKELFLAIKAQIIANLVLPEAYTTRFQYPDCIVYWNSQVREFEQLVQSMTTLPFMAIEIVTPDNIQQLFNGCQFYEPLYIKVHIVDEFYQETDGDGFAQDLNVLDLQEALFECLDQFEPQGAGNFVRNKEYFDTNHGNLVHHITEWKTNYVDANQDRPVARIVKAPDTNLEIDVTVTE